MQKSTIKSIKIGVYIALGFFLFFFLLVQIRDRYFSSTGTSEKSKEVQKVDPSVTIPRYWKFHSGDDSLWLKPGYDDSRWDSMDISMNMDSFPDVEKKFSGIGWFRTQLSVDSALRNKPLGLLVHHYGASEIYIDGKLIHKFGEVGKKQKDEEMYIPESVPLVIQFQDSARHFMSIRYSYHRFKEFYKKYEQSLAGLTVKVITDPAAYTFMMMEITSANSYLFLFLFGVPFTLCFVHFLMFLFYRQQKQNLYYSIFSFFLSITFLSLFLDRNNFNSTIVELVNQQYRGDIILACFLFLMVFLHDLFKPAYYKRVFSIGLVVFIGLLAINFFDDLPIGQTLILSVFWAFMLLICIESIRSIMVGIIRKQSGARIIAGGVLVFIATIILYLIKIFLTGNGNFNINSYWGSFAFVLVLLSIPISMSAYLAYDFARTNKNLKLKLVEVEDLSAKTISQEKEKQEILSQQKEKLEIQVAERTREVVEQKNIVEEKNKDITDSINYAKRIQDAILPSEELIKKMLPESFVLFKPKDIVSGDFYWFEESDNKIFIAVCDCTGHGVPGAIMSMLGADKLNEAFIQNTDVSSILTLVNKGIKKALRQSSKEDSTRDGMDIALCSIELPSPLAPLSSGRGVGGEVGVRLEYAGANRPLYIIRKSATVLEEIKATKSAIGGLTSDEQVFTKHTIALNKGDTVYISSDGFADQFSPEDKKLMTGKLKEILLSIQDKSMEEQKRYLDSFIENWKGNMEQTDDVLVIGVRI